MKRKFLHNLIFTLVVMLAPLGVAAQEPASRPQTKLVVQVEYFKGQPPAYDGVPESVWFGRFMTTAAAKQRSLADTVQAVDVKTRLVGQRVEIKVGVHVGEKQFDRLDPVATYYASEGDTVTASDLEHFGVVPFVFKVMRVNETSAAPPVVVNKTQSVGAEITDFASSPVPRAKLTLRNLSSKGVRAVNVSVVVGNRDRLTRLVAERDGKILMGPGETYSFTISPTVGQSALDNFTPDSAESMVVVTAVFDDYSYEGAAGPALKKKSFDEGERVQLSRIMPLVREAHAAADVESAGAIEKFRAAVSALDDEVPQSAVDAISKQYRAPGPAGQNQVRIATEVSMHRVRRELLEDLDAFEKKFRSAPTENSFKEWLKTRQERFEAWSSRL